MATELTETTPTFESALDATLARIRADVISRRNDHVFFEMRQRVEVAMKVLKANEPLREGSQLRLSLFPDDSTERPDIYASINALMGAATGEIASVGVMMLMEEWDLLRHSTEREIALATAITMQAREKAAKMTPSLPDVESAVEIVGVVVSPEAAAFNRLRSYLDDGVPKGAG